MYLGENRKSPRHKWGRHRQIRQQSTTQGLGSYHESYVVPKQNLININKKII